MSNETPSSAPKVETPNAKNLDNFVITYGFYFQNGSLEKAQAAKTAEFVKGLEGLKPEELTALKNQITAEKQGELARFSEGYLRGEKGSLTGEPPQNAMEQIVSPAKENKADMFTVNKFATLELFEKTVDAKISEKKAGEAAKVEVKVVAAAQALQQEVVAQAPAQNPAQAEKTAEVPAQKPTAKKAEGEWGREAQNKVAAEIAAEKAEVHTVVKGETLGAIALGMKKAGVLEKFSWSMEVTYRLENQTYKTSLTKAGKIFPGNEVSVEDGKVTVELQNEKQKNSVAKSGWTEVAAAPDSTNDGFGSKTGDETPGESTPPPAVPDTQSEKPAVPAKAPTPAAPAVPVIPKAEAPAAPTKKEPAEKPAPFDK